MSIEDTEANYTPLQRKEVTFDEYVYMVTAGPLPKHIRSLSIKDNRARNIVPALSKPRFSSTRLVYVTLALVFILVTSVAVGIAVVKIAEIKSQSNKMLLQVNTSLIRNSNQNVTHMERQTSLPIHMLANANDKADGDVTSRTRCVQNCLTYNNPKFESRCVHGMCVCRGSNYQPLTCLPNVSGCLVAKVIDSSAKASMYSERKSVYSCSSEPYTGSDVHVISVYGNHYARVTTVNISGTVTGPVTIVLASHYPIHWNIKHEGIRINKIVLLSKDWFAASSVTVETQYSENSIDSNLEIQKLRSPVGFGDDRHRSDTVGMLRAITEIFGSFRTFHGADYADYWTVKIPE